MTRTKLIQTLISKLGYKSYLEIGCANNHNFNQINVPIRIGVDPGEGGTHRMTSDVFFAQNNQKFDLIFIDGLHVAEQVDKDINNSIKFLNPNGTIVMHDCNPQLEEHQRPYVVVSIWNGDVWKSLVKVRGRDDIDAVTSDFDHGCAVLRIRGNTDKINVTEDLTFENLVKNRNKWLRIKNFNEIMGWI